MAFSSDEGNNFALVGMAAIVCEALPSSEAPVKRRQGCAVVVKKEGGGVYTGSGSLNVLAIEGGAIELTSCSKASRCCRLDRLLGVGVGWGP